MLTRRNAELGEIRAEHHQHGRIAQCFGGTDDPCRGRHRFERHVPEQPNDRTGDRLPLGEVVDLRRVSRSSMPAAFVGSAMVNPIPRSWPVIWLAAPGNAAAFATRTTAPSVTSGSVVVVGGRVVVGASVVGGSVVVGTAVVGAGVVDVSSTVVAVAAPSSPEQALVARMHRVRSQGRRVGGGASAAWARSQPAECHGPGQVTMRKQVRCTHPHHSQQRVCTIAKDGAAFDTPDVQEHESLPRRCDARNVIRRSAAGAAVVIGTASLVGWIIDGDALRRVSSGFVAMSVDAALLIVLLGVSFLIRSPRAVFVLRAVVLAVASLTLARYAFGWHVGIDELFVRDTTSVGGSSPGRMSVTTALCFVLIALGGRAAVMGRRSIAQLAGVAVSLLGWLAALGYLFGAEALYKIGPFSSVAVNTAVAIALLGLALQATIPGSVVSWVAVGGDLGSQMAWRLIPVSLVIVPLLARLVQAATSAGWLRSEFGLAVVVLTASLAVIGVALPLGRRLSSIDGQRAAAAIELARANSRLEERVEERTSELVQAEAQFRAAFESAPIGMALVSSDGRMIRVNESLSSMLGHSRGDPAVDVDERTAPSRRGGSRLARRAVRCHTRERRLVCADGSEVWVSIRQTTVSGVEGETNRDAYSLVQLVDVGEQRRFAEQMAHLANHDPLTGLLNRRSFESALEQHVARVERYGAEGAVLLLDLDHFKRINDTYGHSVGDQVIVHVAHAIRSRLRGPIRGSPRR